MSELSVWSPKSKSVTLEFAGRHVPMERGLFGWWTAAAPDNAGDYAFILDDNRPIPDPRSPWQPYGVHGASRLVDQSAFKWTDHGWQAADLSSALIYELHIGTFTE